VFYDMSDTADSPAGLGAVIVPRPIGWISTISAEGAPNLAPYSYFNALSDAPPIVALGCAPDGREGAGADGRKDTRRNIEETGEFVWNLATLDLLEAMDRTAESVAPEEDEFDLAGLTRAPSEKVRPPRVAESPVHAECVYMQTLQMRDGHAIVLGEVIGLHVADDLLIDHPTRPGHKRIDIVRARPLARLGGTYSSIDRAFVPGR